MINNSLYEILTPTGFQDFDGLKITEKNKSLKIYFHDYSSVQCSFEHRFIDINGNEIYANQLDVGMKLISSADNFKMVCYVELVIENNKFYDLFNVSNGHVYFTNDVLSHNCDCNFTTSGHTFIEADDLAYYRSKTKDPIERRGIGGDLWIWDYPKDGCTYAVTADVARGDGEDYSTYSVRDIETMDQVAEYKGKVDTTTFANMLMSICHEYGQAYLIIDNKNIGWSTIQVIIDKHYPNLFYSYKNDPYLDRNIHLIRQYDMKTMEEMVPGFTITHILRPVMTEKLRIYMQERSFIVNSTRAINELEVFLWINGKPQAQKGYNDDLVMESCMFLYVRDTVLRLKGMGMEITRNAIGAIHRSVYKPKQTSHPSWEQTYGNHKERLNWLL